MRALHGDRTSIHRARCRQAVTRLRLSVLATFMLVAFVLSSGSALAAETHEFLGSFGPDGTEATNFVEARAVAVDEAAEIIYVLDRTGGGSLSKFDFEGNPVPFSGSALNIVGNQITGLSVSESGSQQIAVDQVSHNIYVEIGSKVLAFEASGEPYLFTAGPGAGTNEIDPLGEPEGVAVDRFGALYVPAFETGSNHNNLEVYDSSGEQLLHEENIAPVRHVRNLTVGTDNELYIVLFAGGVSKFLLSEVPVTSKTTVDDGGQFVPFGAGFDFEPIGLATNRVTGNIYVAERGVSSSSRVGVYDDAGKLVTSFAGPGQEGESEGAVSVAVDAESGKAFVADQLQGGNSQIKIFGPVVDRPAITEAFVTKVTGDSAILGASINPNTLETSYRLEYGLGDCSVAACTSFPTVGIGAGYSPVAAGSQQVFGLQPGTTYHYRVVAQNSKGTSEANGTFTTQTTGFGFQLADSRAWEMVSPPQKFGARLFMHQGGPIQAAEDGNGLVFQSLGSIEEDPEGSGAPEASSVLSRRIGVDWQAKDLTVPRGEPVFPGSVPDYSLFSPDLSRATVSPKDGFPLSPEASGNTPYLRTNAEPATYTPMVTAKEGFANVPPGTELSQSNPPLVVGASRDLNLVALRSEVPLFAGAEQGAVYGWRAEDRQLRPISVLPAEHGEAVVSGLLGSGGGSVRNAVSADGSRAFWSQGKFSAPLDRPTALLVRDLETEESVRLDVPEPDAGGFGNPAPVFQAASADGTVAVFSDTQQLTKDASPEGQDLYRCQLPPQGEPPGCELTNLTAPTVNPGENGGFLGLVPGMNEDGTRLYFVAKGVLDSEPNQAGEEAVAGEPNLYLWRQGEGVRYLATLSQADQSAWGSIGTAFENDLLSASTSPSGRYLTFMSARSLTGYDNHDDSSGQPVQEAYRYDAVADSLVCVSCNPTGARPDGEFRGSKRFPPVEPNLSWRHMWAAATLPTGRQSTFDTESGAISLSRPRAVLDNGRVFFNAVDGLVPADSNGNWDVYQYEPGGVGDCSVSSGGPSTVYAAGGCVSLISSGTGEEEAGFIDASVSGDDVFFLTAERLAVTDVDGEYDVYDARVDGVPARLETSSQCQGEACQPSAIAPNDPTPGTATYQGPGNPKPKARPRKRCAKKHQQRAKRASRKGKASCRRHNGGRAGR